MNKRLKFFSVATPVIWLLIIVPLATLASWWLAISTLKVVGWSLLCAPFVTLWIYSSFQTANLKAKWPATQLIGLCTVLMNVVIFSSPLLIFVKPATVAAIATVLWLLISCYAVWKAHKVEVKTVIIKNRKLQTSHRVMHLSDLHAGSRSTAFIQRMVQKTNAQNPDIVLITGDLIDSSAVNASYLKPLSKFCCPVYLSLGNHEKYINLENAISAIEANNVTALRSKSAVSGDLHIIGIDDEEDPKHLANTLPQINRDKTKFEILMYHRPHGFEDAALAGIDLMLCGHTHAGQMWPFGLLVKRQFPHMKGSYQNKDSTLYVSQGTGTWGPTMRLGTSCEMTLLNLQPQ